jgi:hypothetical protein
MVLLSACTGTPSRTGFYSSPLLPGDEVEILREIVVPAERARVYLQHGKVTGYGGSDQYAPFCYFLLRDPMPAEQVIGPGVLTVEKAWLNQTTVALDSPIRLVSALSLGGGNQSVMAWQFHITLKAADEGRVILVCSGAFDGPGRAEPIRLPEVREALGSYAEVRVTATSQ